MKYSINQIKNFGLVFLIAQTVLFACKPDPITPPPPANEEEIITTLRITFTDSANNANTKTAVFRDADGEGGQQPTIDSVKLAANKTYYASIILLDETKSPADTISHEVEEEANDHQLFYEVKGLNISINYEDKDSNNPPLPLGLKTKWKTRSAGSGTAQIILKHQPGTKNNTQTPGETDIDISFPIKVE